MSLIYLVVYQGADCRPYACAFSDRTIAARFAEQREGEVIETEVDRMADLVEAWDDDNAEQEA